MILPFSLSNSYFPPCSADFDPCISLLAPVQTCSLRPSHFSNFLSLLYPYFSESS